MSDSNVAAVDPATLEHLLTTQPNIVQQLAALRSRNALTAEQTQLFNGLLQALEVKRRQEQQQQAQQQLANDPATAALVAQFREERKRESSLNAYIGRQLPDAERQRALVLLEQTRNTMNSLMQQIQAHMRRQQEQQSAASPSTNNPDPKASAAPSQLTVAALAAMQVAARGSPSLGLPAATTPDTMPTSAAYMSSIKAEQPGPSRPSLTQGLSTLAPHLGTPSVTRAPTNALNERNGIVSKRKLQELLDTVVGEHGRVAMDPDVEDLLLEIADEFVDSVTKFACKLARHRNSDRLEAQDIQLHLERNWGYKIPGWGSDMVKVSQTRKTNQPPGHLARLAAAREAQRKRM